MSIHKWSDAENLFLRSELKRFALWSDVLSEMRERFGTDVTANAVKVHAKQLGVQLGLPNKYSAYSEEERKYITENIGKKTLQELADGLKALTGRSCTKTAIGHFINDSLGIVPSGIHGNLSAWEQPYNTAELGKQRTNAFDGYTYIKTVDGWKAKHQVVWEDANGELPKGGLIVFLNNDKTDFSIENLYCGDRKIHAVMCRNGWYTESREHTLTAIKWCELFYAIKAVSDRKEG